MPLPASELILNQDQSIYHLNLLPQDMADIIITVGDPDRVSMVSAYFDNIELVKQKREFLTHTGTYKSKRITVISSGIGTDNIDIVLNELDALANIDFKTRKVKEHLKSLHIIRIGTSGAVQADIPLGSLLISEKAIGLDALLHFYESEAMVDIEFSNAFIAHMKWDKHMSHPYTIDASPKLLSIFNNDQFIKGVTLTNVGFYGPQARTLRLKPSLELLHQKLKNFTFQEKRITNLEMETSGIYGLSKLLGHQAISVNCILANRATSEFSKQPNKVVNKAIKITLDLIANSL
jgi:uridine phosphorylase